MGELDRRRLKGFAMHADEQRRLFKLLADASIHARYTESYATIRERSGYVVGRTRCRQAFGIAIQGA